MRTTAELLVLDKPVRPDAPIGLTAQTGLTGLETALIGQAAENNESAATSNSKGKAEVKDGNEQQKPAYPRAPDPMGKDTGARVCPWARIRVGF